MTALGRQAAITTALVLLLWAALDYSLLGLPAMREYIHATREIIPLLHKQETAQIIGDLHLLARTDKPKIILLGASTTQDVLLPPQLAVLFPGYEVHGLALSHPYGGTSIQGNMRVMEAAREAMSPAARAASVFVYGAVIAMFDADLRNSGDTAFDDACGAMFPRLYRRTDAGVGMRFGRACTMAFLRFMRPFFAARRAAEALQEGSWAFFLGNTGNGVPVRPAGKDGRTVEQDAIFMAQHEVLLENPLTADLARNPRLIAYDGMIGHADKNAIKLLVVALPIHRGLREKHPVYAEFVERLRKGVENAKSGTVKFLDMSTLLSDSAFRDAYHMYPGAAPYCALELWEKWPYQ